MVGSEGRTTNIDERASVFELLFSSIYPITPLRWSLVSCGTMIVPDDSASHIVVVIHCDRRRSKEDYQRPTGRYRCFRNDTPSGRYIQGTFIRQTCQTYYCWFGIYRSPSPYLSPIVEGWIYVNSDEARAGSGVPWFCLAPRIAALASRCTSDS